MIVLGYMASKYMPLHLNLSCLSLLFVATEYHLLLSEMLQFFKSKLVAWLPCAQLIGIRAEKLGALCVYSYRKLITHMACLGVC